MHGQLQIFLLSVFDASSKLQNGILSGNVLDHGPLKQCISIRQPTESGLVKGKQCSLNLVPDEEWLRTIIVTIRGVSDKVLQTNPLSLVDILWVFF